LITFCAVPAGLPRFVITRFPSTHVLGYICTALRAAWQSYLQQTAPHEHARQNDFLCLTSSSAQPEISHTRRRSRNTKPEGRHNRSPARKRWVSLPTRSESRSDSTNRSLSKFGFGVRLEIIPVCLIALSPFLAAPVFAIDREAFTITRYQLEAQIDRTSHVMAVNGTLALRNDSSAPQKVVALQVTSSFAWNSITLDDKPVQWLSDNYTSDIDHTGSLSEAIVNLPKAVPPAGTVTLAIQYGGTVTPSATRLTRMGTPDDIAARSDWDEISDAFTAVRGLGYVAWYPVAIEAVSMSDGNAAFDAIAAWKHRHSHSSFEAKIAAPGGENETLCIALNSGSGCGETRITTDAETGGKTKEFTHTLTLGRMGDIVPTFALGNYVELSRPTVSFLHTAEHTSLARDYAVAAEASDPLLRDWLGEPNQPPRIIELTEPKALPYESGSVLFTPLRPWPADTLQLLLLSTQVSSRFQSTHPWIQEGLQRFLQCVLVEGRSGRKAALDYLDDFREPLVKAEAAALPKPDAPGKAPQVSSSDNTLLNTNDELYLRGKGSFVFWMLRDMLGETALRSALANYRLEADRDPSYLQRLLQVSSKRDLEWFFDDWVYRDRGLPDFHVESAYARTLLDEANSSFLETVTIVNTGHAGAEVPVIIQTPSGEKTVRVLARAGEKGTGRLEVPVAPDRITVNDGSVPAANTNNVYDVPAQPKQ
jgi:hypothetical protein